MYRGTIGKSALRSLHSERGASLNTPGADLEISERAVGVTGIVQQVSLYLKGGARALGAALYLALR